MTTTVTVHQRRTADAVSGRRFGDEGSVSIMTAVFAAALLLVFALLVDGSGKLRATSRADTVAAEAARAALSAVDTRSPSIGVDLNSAVAAARAYLVDVGYAGSVQVTGPRTVRVTVTVEEPGRIGLLGPTYRVTATATAELESGTHAPTSGGLP